MFSVGEILGDLSSSMAILDEGNEACVGFDLARQFVAEDVEMSLQNSRSAVWRRLSVAGARRGDPRKTRSAKQL
ncbi:MAG: hypothetical protein KA603_04505 [Azonexus sp.]|nr:hypothetical protein [Betaproteobacteria bacterium]MBK8918162.1 hypothetical protein [Betaproteobacteria bacterium]MBP6035379.1 hypothetical protein [Azonexus sp.]MBP6906046.1 hypothetical protein [Azonexus sp.]